MSQSNKHTNPTALDLNKQAIIIVYMIMVASSPCMQRHDTLYKMHGAVMDKIFSLFRLSCELYIACLAKIHDKTWETSHDLLWFWKPCHDPFCRGFFTSFSNYVLGWQNFAKFIKTEYISCSFSDWRKFWMPGDSEGCSYLKCKSECNDLKWQFWNLQKNSLQDSRDFNLIVVEKLLL